MKNEKWDDVHGNTTPDDRMVAFLESPTDSYAILQLREDVDDNIPLIFANYSYLQKKEMEPEIDRYEVVYHGSISVYEDVDRQLEDLYVKFNIDHPNDFRGHSMSVSDIVALKVAGEVSFHYVDSVGFQKLENFMKSENYLKNAEMAMEDDYGMIDGMLRSLTFTFSRSMVRCSVFSAACSFAWVSRSRMEGFSSRLIFRLANS